MRKPGVGKILRVFYKAIVGAGFPQLLCSIGIKNTLWVVLYPIHHGSHPCHERRKNISSGFEALPGFFQKRNPFLFANDMIQWAQQEYAIPLAVIPVFTFHGIGTICK